MFTIKHFDDYQEINDSYIELGCFKTKRGNYDYCRYFAIRYDRKPSVNAVLEKLDKILNYNYYRPIKFGHLIAPCREEVKQEVVRALKRGYKNRDV